MLNKKLKKRTVAAGLAVLIAASALVPHVQAFVLDGNWDRNTE